VELGGVELPNPVPMLMKLNGRVMTSLVYRV